jgi:integrase
VASIKHLYSYLRRTAQLTAQQDPTLHALRVPAGRPAQDANGSKVIEQKDVDTVLPRLDAWSRDACTLMMNTGCHLSEVYRFAKAGAIEPRADGSGSAVLGFVHKGGHVHRIEVSQSLAKVAERLKGASQPPSRNVVYRRILAACREARVAPWTPGRFRHTFATRAVQRGANPQAVALYLGHRSSATTLRWYSTTAVAPRVGP